MLVQFGARAGEMELGDSYAPCFSSRRRGMQNGVRSAFCSAKTCLVYGGCLVLQFPWLNVAQSRHLYLRLLPIPRRGI